MASSSQHARSSVDTDQLDANTVQTPNLTKQDAALRARLLRVESYDVVLDLTDADGAPSSRTFRSRSTITFDATEPGASTFVDVIADRLHEVSLNGSPVDVTDYEPADGIVLPELAAHNVLVVDADLLYTSIGQGLHRFVDPLDDEVYLYSQFETTDAKRMFACFDQPDLKGTFSLRVTAPANWKLISNGAPSRVEDGAKPNTKTVQFATTPRLSTYLTALVAGAYHEVRESHDGIDLGLFCRRSMAEDLDHEDMFTVTKQGFDWYHQHFGVRYAFGKYDQLFVPEFNAGAMENAACVTFSGGLRLSQPGDRRPLRAARRDGAARDGAHVVRRPGDHALVRRPVAQRVVRRVGRHHLAGRGNPMDQCLDHLRQHREDLGVPAGPASLHPFDLLRHPGCRSGRGELRRHHLRQGCQRAQAAGRLRRPGGLPGRRPAVLRRQRLRQHDAGGSAHLTAGGVRPGAVRLGQGVAGDQRGEHHLAELPGGRGGQPQLLRGAADRTDRDRQGQRAAAAPAGHRLLQLRLPSQRRAPAGPAGPYPAGAPGPGRRADPGAAAGRAGAAGPGAGER